MMLGKRCTAATAPMAQPLVLRWGEQDIHTLISLSLELFCLTHFSGLTSGGGVSALQNACC